MKRKVACLVLAIMVLLSGCRYQYIKAEEGSKWSSAEQLMDIEIVDGGAGAVGKLAVNGEILEIEIFFGSDGSDYAVYELIDEDAEYYDGDAWLFVGEYRYSAINETITLKINHDQIGLDIEKIVLYKA